MRKLDFKAIQNLSLVTHIGMVMIIPIFGGVYIGNYLDIRFGTGSIFLFVFIIIGIITAFMNLFKIALRKTNDKDRK